MSTQPYGFLTVAGRAAEAAALANGTAIEVTEIAWGTGTRAITGGETALQTETGRAAVNAFGIDPDNDSVAFFRRQFAAEEGPFSISEAGLFDAEGTLLAIVSYPVPLSKPLNFALTLDILVAFSDLENLIISVESAEAFVPAERKVSTGDGLTGGGDLAQDRTINLDFSNLPALTAAAAHLTSDTVIIWDDSANRFKTVNLDTIAEKVIGTSRFDDALTGKSRWQIKSAAYTAKAGERIAADVSGGAWQLNLPAAPAAGDVVRLAVINGDVATNNLTVSGNGKNVQGDAALLIDVPFATLSLIYNNTEWRVA
jgi:phage-related tail fiber protein